MDTGKAFQRQRFTAAVQPFSGKIWVDQSQYETFFNFYTVITAMGAVEFDWQHPITKSPAVIRFDASSPPSVKPLSGGQYEISLNLEVIP